MCARGLSQRALDDELWNEIEVGDRFHPEIERLRSFGRGCSSCLQRASLTCSPNRRYIQYDVEKLGEPGTIEPHRDNESQATVVLC